MKPFRLFSQFAYSPHFGCVPSHSGVPRLFDTPPSAHPLSSAPAREKCTLARWHPNDSLPGTATIFAIAPAIPSTGAGASDQSSPTISIREKTRSFAEAARVQSSSSAGSDNQHDQATGGQHLRADTPAQSQEEQTTKQWLKSFGPQEVKRVKRCPNGTASTNTFRWADSTKTLVPKA